MIKYKVKGNIVINDNTDKNKTHYWEEEFDYANPIIARQNAIKRYNDIIDEIKKDGKSIEKLTTGTDLDYGLGIGVYIEILYPMDNIWDGIDIDKVYGFGTLLEESAQEWIDEGHIDEIDEFPLQHYSWLIVGVGNLSGYQSQIVRLEDEMKIYDFLNYDTNGEEEKIKEHRILRIPFDWSSYDEIQSASITEHSKQGTVTKEKQENSKMNFKANSRQWLRIENDTLQVTIQSTGNIIPSELQNEITGIIKKWNLPSIKEKNVARTQQEPKGKGKLKDESEEIKRVEKKIPIWFRKYPKTISSKILVNYMEIYSSKGSVSFEELEKACSSIGEEKLKSHLNQMNGFGEKNHAKIFEYDYSNKIILWNSVKEFIEKEYKEFTERK